MATLTDQKNKFIIAERTKIASTFDGLIGHCSIINKNSSLKGICLHYFYFDDVFIKFMKISLSI